MSGAGGVTPPPSTPPCLPADPWIFHLKTTEPLFSSSVTPPWIGRLDFPVHTEGWAARRRRSACDPLCRGLYLAVTHRKLIHRYLGDREYRRCEGCPGREMKDSGVRSVLPDCYPDPSSGWVGGTFKIVVGSSINRRMPVEPLFAS